MSIMSIMKKYNYSQVNTDISDVIPKLESQIKSRTHKVDCSITENFFKERSRMCSTVTCSECPLHHPYDNCENIVVFHHDKAMEIIQKWSDEHPEEPVKTFADDFFEKFPNALRDENGVPCVGCPHHFEYCEYKCDRNCKECWNRLIWEVKK